MNICNDCKHVWRPFLLKIFNLTPTCEHPKAFVKPYIRTDPLTGEQSKKGNHYTNCRYERCFGDCGHDGKNFEQRIYNEIKKAS